MNTSTLSVICVFMTLAMALSVYGMGGYSYMPYYGAQQGNNPLGVGQGGLLMLFGVLFLFIFLLNGNLFNTNTGTTTPNVTIIQG